MPESARRVFPSERMPLVERYAGWLADAGVVRGLIGPREVPRLWERHLLNCAVLGDAVVSGGGEEATVADLGTGAGLPGLVLALRHPGLRVTLVEPLLRRTSFLEEVVADLDLAAQVEVVRARAEELHGTRSFDVVTSRAVAPLPRLLAWSMPLVAPQGRLVVMKGSRVHEEVREARDDLAGWQTSEPEVVVVGEGVVEPATTVLQVAWADPGRVGWPGRPQPSPAQVAAVQRQARRGTGSRRRPGRSKPGR